MADPELARLRTIIESLPSLPQRDEALAALSAVEDLCARRSKLAEHIQSLLDEMRSALSSTKNELELVRTERDALRGDR